MKRFADLYMRLDATTGSNAKLEAMQAYFRDADPADAAWAVYFLAGGRPRQLVATKTLRRLALEASGYPEWLLEESYQAVGDLAETVALLLPSSEDAQEFTTAYGEEDDSGDIVRSESEAGDERNGAKEGGPDVPRDVSAADHA